MEPLSDAASFWDFFYESAWKTRLEKIKEFMADGPTNPLRVIGQLNSFERYHSFYVGYNTAGEKAGSYSRFENIRAGEIRNLLTQGGSFNFDMEASQFLPNGQPIYENIPFGGGIVPVPRYHFTRGLDRLLADYLQSRKFDAIVELGGGYGQNLFELYYAGGPRVPYYSGEFTKSGFEACSLLNTLTHEFEVKPFYFNHENPDLSPIREKGRVFFFTAHSIEQVEKIPEDYFLKMVRHAEYVEAMHFEPFGFQLVQGALSAEDEQHQKNALSQKWNVNFIQTLLASHSRGDIDVTYIGKNCLGGHVGNPTSLAAWKKKIA